MHEGWRGGNRMAADGLLYSRVSVTDTSRHIPDNTGKHAFKFYEGGVLQRRRFLLFPCLCSFWHPSRVCVCFSVSSKSALKEGCQNIWSLRPLPSSSLHPPSVCYHAAIRSVSLTGVIIFTQLWLTGPAPSPSWQPVYFWRHVIKFSSDLERDSPLSPFPLRAWMAGGLS